MADAHASLNTSLHSPARRAAEVAPNDSADLSDFTRALYVGVAGSLRVTTVGGDTVDFVGASGFLPVCVARVHATGTDATSIVALW